MVLEKNPASVPDDFTDFQEIFPDINSPGLFIADSDDKFVPKAVILDGHSTLLVFTADAKDVTWEAYQEQASYLYAPDKLDDGAVLIPHNFYFEFSIELSDRLLLVYGNFGGANINALVMPLNNVPPKDFAKTLQNRLSSAFSTVLKPIDQSLKVEKGAVLDLPSSAKSDISLKLALLGITLDKITIMTENVLPPQETGEVVEQIFDTPQSSIVEQLKREEEEKKVKRSAKSKKKAMPKKEEKATISTSPKLETMPQTTLKPSPNPPPPKQKPMAPAPKMKSTAPPPKRAGPPVVGGSKSSGLGAGAPAPGGSKVSGLGGGGPAPPGPKGSVSPPPPSMPPAVTASSMPPGPMPEALPKPAPAVERERSAAAPVIKEDMSPPVPFPIDNEVEEELDDGLLPKELSKSDKLVDVQRYTNTSYFERMIPNRSYSLKIEIASKEIIAAASKSSIISGEKASEQAGSFIAKDTIPITIRPIIPGSIVVPESQTVGPKEDVEVEFFVTPIALGKMDANIQFLQENKVFHTIPLKMKIINHRLAKIIGYVSILTSAVPAMFAFVANEPLDVYMKPRINTFVPAISSLGYLFPFITSGVVLLGSLSFVGLRNLSMRKQSKTSLSFPR